MTANNKLMILGGIDAGKSTLTDVLLGKDSSVQKNKTQALVYNNWIVDTPGEYVENPLFYRSVLATSMEITHVAFVQDSTTDKTVFAPGFSSGINKLPIGVVTKLDHEEADLNRSIELLKRTLIRGPIVLTSAFTREGIELIYDLIKLNTMEEMKEYVENSDSTNILFYELQR